MNRADVVQRNQVLRAFFEGKGWDANDEFKLKRALVLGSDKLLPAYPFLIDDEWEVVPGKTNLGRGDLVFADGEGRFAVVEVKFIDLGRSGSTVRAKRTESRKKVVEQARDYASKLAALLGPDVTVEACWYTNEEPEAVHHDTLGCEGSFVAD